MLFRSNLTDAQVSINLSGSANTVDSLGLGISSDAVDTAGAYAD